MGIAKASTSRRFVGWVIDIAILLAIGFIMESFGDAAVQIFPFLMLAYLLFRDVTGVSIGKYVLRMRVEGRSQARIVRNATIAAGSLVGVAGVSGPVDTIASSLILVECLYILVRGERIGDRLAGTEVVMSVPPQSQLE